MNLPSFPNVDLFSAGINALYGTLVARQPSHESPAKNRHIDEESCGAAHRVNGNGFTRPTIPARITCHEELQRSKGRSLHVGARMEGRRYNRSTLNVPGYRVAKKVVTRPVEWEVEHANSFPG
jgi:hypothetical protein